MLIVLEQSIHFEITLGSSIDAKIKNQQKGVL